MAKKKINGRVVPRGIIQDGKYVYVRIFHEGKVIKRCIGLASVPGVLAVAIQRLNDFRQQIRNNNFGIEERAERITIEKACDVYWNRHAASKKSSKDYKRTLDCIKSYFAGRLIDTITYLDVEAYRRYREGKVSASSVNREHTVITHLFNALKEWRRLKVIHNVRLPEENPGALVSKTNERQFRRKRVLTPEEFDRFLKSATIQVRRICLAAVYTALRRKDLMLLTRSNINEDTNQIEGIQAKTGRPYSVPIIGDMAQIIATATGNKILNFTNFRKQFEEAKTRAGLDFQFRDLRRTAGRMMLQKGADLATVSSYLGHSTIAMTEAYVQSEKEQKRIAGEILGSLYRPPTADSSQKLSEKLSYEPKISEAGVV